MKTKNARVMVTGGSSMIGRAICKSLKNRGIIVDPVPHEECDLLHSNEALVRLLEFEPDYVIHAAGWNGGINWNKQYPATIYERTIAIGMNVFSAIRKCKTTKAVDVKKVVNIMASCSYPDKGWNELSSDYMWEGAPNPTVECHGLAKRTIEAYGRQLNKQYDTNIVSCVLTNSYGPFDSFHSDKTKVVGALIRKFVESKFNGAPEVQCWGTGSPLREFMFSADAGEAIVQTLEKYDDKTKPLNLGSGQEISIKELTEIIAEKVGYTGNISWDTSKPDGQYRKRLDTSLMNEYLDVPITNIEDGIQETVAWYLDNKKEADAKGF